MIVCLQNLADKLSLDCELMSLLTTIPHTEPLDQYLKSFSWNKVKYRADRPIAELIDLLQKVCCSRSLTINSQTDSGG